MEKKKRKKNRSGRNDVDFGQEGGQSLGSMLCEVQAQENISSDAFEVMGRASRGNRVLEVALGWESEDLVSHSAHTASSC